MNHFDIRKEFVVNADQTGWYLAPHRGRTLAFRGVKSVPMEVHGDKRQVTMMVALRASGEMLPLQLYSKCSMIKARATTSAPPRPSH